MMSKNVIHVSVLRILINSVVSVLQLPISVNGRDVKQHIVRIVKRSTYFLTHKVMLQILYSKLKRFDVRDSIALEHNKILRVLYSHNSL